MAGNKQRISYPFWAESPNLALIRQPAPPIVEFNSFLRYLWRPLERIVGSPFIEYCILDELLGYLKTVRRLKTIGIDVCLQESAFQNCTRLGSLPKEYILRELGAWLTQQIAAISKEQHGSLPETFVRCSWDEPEQESEGHRKLYRNLPTNRLIKQQSAHEPLFKVKIPIQSNNSHNNAIFTIISPPPQEKLCLDLDENPNIGKNTLPNHHSKNLALVDCEHAEILSVTYPSDGIDQLWIRHLGNHETWIGNAKMFQPISQGVWFPLISGNFIILGRVLGKSTGRRVLPGSLVLKVQENEWNNQNSAPGLV